MKLPVLFVCQVLLFVLVFMSFVSQVVIGEKDTEKLPEKDKGTSKKQLQIGVKKRIADCKVRSRKGDILHMHYQGLLEDGTEFDSSFSREMPLTFTLGAGQVIKGWDQGLLGMCEGEERKLTIPPDLAYGAAGSPPKIPPNSVLIFNVKLVKIERRDEL